MIVELKKGYTIESRYDKFSDSYITRLLDNESKQVGDALSSKDIVGKNQDIKSVRDYFTNYINNKRVEEEIPDEIDYIEPEEEFEEEEDIFEESLNLEDFDSIIKQKARKTKKATRKAKLPALSKMSPIMPDYAKGIDAFNSMQADGNSSMGSTTGSISLGEEFKDRNSLIKELQDMGFNYKFDKYSDKQLFRIYQERLVKLKKLKAQKEKEQKEADLRDQKIENSKDSYFRDGIEFESEEAAKDYFGESMDNKFYLNDMHKAWDIIDPEDEVSIPTTRSSLNESKQNSRNRILNEAYVSSSEQKVYQVEFIYTYETDDECANYYDYVNVKASSEDEAINKAKDYVTSTDYENAHVERYNPRGFRISNSNYKNVDMVESLNEESLNTKKEKNIHNFRSLNEGLHYFNKKAFEDNCQDLGLDLMLESVRDKLTKDDIKKLGALMNKTDDPDDVVTYVKGLLSEDLDNTVHITYRKSGYGGFTAGGEEVNIRNYASKFDEVVGDISGIYIAILLRSNIGHSYYDKIIFSNNLDECKRAANDWLYSPDKGSVTYNDEHYYAMIVDLSKNEEIAHGDTWYTGGRISKGWREFPLKEDFDLDQFKDNLEREKDYYGEKAQGLKMLAFPLKRKIEKICNDFWADEYATAVDDLNDEISFAYEVEGDWKHDHLRFQNAVLNMLYEEGYEDVNHYEDVIDDDGSDTYKAIHTFEINASRQNQLSESLDEPFLHTTAPGEIDMAIEYFLEECKYSGYKAEITEVAEEDGYFIISGYIDEDVRSETSPSEILDILLDQLDMFDISVDVYTNWQINRLYRRMIFDITTKYHLENVNESLKEDWSWPEENGYINDAHERITFILDELAKIGFKHDEKYPIRDGLFGRKHIQIINPDLITSEETFEEDIKPLVDVLNSIEETFGETARMTYNIGANDDLQVTAGIDVGVK